MIKHKRSEETEIRTARGGIPSSKDIKKTFAQLDVRNGCLCAYKSEQDMYYTSNEFQENQFPGFVHLNLDDKIKAFMGINSES